MYSKFFSLLLFLPLSPFPPSRSSVNQWLTIFSLFSLSSNWLSIIYTLVWTGREASDQDFFNTVTELVKNERPALEIMNIAPSILTYFQNNMDKTVHPNGKYWVYPDRDRVTWAQPFSKRDSFPSICIPLFTYLLRWKY